MVTYSNAAKQKLLGVHAETLDQHGAVSKPVAREMAEGARQQTQADYALSVTGIAGPSGGTPVSTAPRVPGATSECISALPRMVRLLHLPVESEPRLDRFADG